MKPEVTRDEIIGGRRVVASPAEPPQAILHTRLNYVMRAHVASGYHAASDLLTRYDEDSDFATDTCLFKEGVDPATGGRYLEEIAFEVVSEQSERLATEKALRMHCRGVRRIFTVGVEKQQVWEWSPESRSWLPLDAASQIEDPCLVTPLKVGALFDSATADEAVWKALRAKGKPVIRALEAAAEVKGIAEAILSVLGARGLAVSAEERQEILHCQDRERLDPVVAEGCRRRFRRRGPIGILTSEPDPRGLIFSLGSGSILAHPEML